MKNTIKWFGFIAVIAVIGFSMIACGGDQNNDGTDYGSDNGGQELPAASGVNAVSGKIYYEDGCENITFSATAEGDANGTYVRGYPNNGTYAAGVKFTYRDRETGTYTWNEGAKTVTLKPGKLPSSDRIAVAGGSDDGSTIIDFDYEPLVDRTAYRSIMQAKINEWIEEEGQAAVNKELSSMGFSSVSAYIDYEVNELFANQTYGYSFSADGTALFLEKALPENKGTNEFTGQTYHWSSDSFGKDTQQVYVFTDSGYTFTNLYGWGGSNHTGSYAYDSNLKYVWLRKSTINGKDRKAYYAEKTAVAGHHLADDNAYRAAQTNFAFSLWGNLFYKSTNKIIYSK